MKMISITLTLAAIVFHATGIVTAAPLEQNTDAFLQTFIKE